MKLENYRSGEYMRMDGYKAFILSAVNYNWSWEDEAVAKLLAEASIQLGELNAYSKLIPNADIYIKMLVRLEANKSSKISGANILLEEALLDLEDVEKEKANDCLTVQNCIQAINYGVKKIDEGADLDAKLIKDMQKILTQGLDREGKGVGKLRTSQKWVGNGDIQDAIYVPPPHTELVDCLTDFEKFINNEEIYTPDLVKIAMLHYQFESILPFLDGNGRLGRMIVPLYLKKKGLLDKACLYLSDFMEQNQNRYYESLTKVRNNSDMIGYIKFFLEMCIESAKIAKERLKKADEFWKEMNSKIEDIPVKPDNSSKILEALFEEPILNIEKLAKMSGIKSGTMRTVLLDLMDKGLVEQNKTHNKSKIITFRKYIDAFMI